jgi:hypothetical protein
MMHPVTQSPLQQLLDGVLMFISAAIVALVCLSLYVLGVVVGKYWQQWSEEESEPPGKNGEG